MNALRMTTFAMVLLGVTACAGGVGTSLGGGPLQCNPGTQVQLARPFPGQAGVNGNIGSVEIVANGNNNVLYSTYTQWNLVLTDSLGDRVLSGPLNLVADPNGPHPFASDFFYSGSIQLLPAGITWNVQLNQGNSNCTPFPLNSFST